MKFNALTSVVLSISCWIFVAAVPLLFIGLSFEMTARGWIESLANKRTALLLVSCGLLASDILLPIPSSFVCTVCGQSVPWPLATVACGLGMMIGSVIGFTLARSFGRKLALRFSSLANLTLIDRLVVERGVWWLILLRPLPILAEACILLCGVHRLPWLPFLCASGASSFAFAGAFVALGSISVAGKWSTAAWILSLALPLAAMFLIRACMERRPRRQTE